MNATIVLFSFAVVIFVAAFITKRRFGLLGLGLAAGSILSVIWAYDIGLEASLFGAPSGPITKAIVSCLLILFPAVILLFHGDKYKSMAGRVIGAILFTLLAVGFLIEPLSHAVSSQGFGSEVFNWILDNRNTIIGAGLTIAIIDLILTKPAHFPSKHHKKH
ncbi:MAG: hypothetical protein NTV39_00915 [Candidatus Saccharibacteria bacterium]|nr:hypothetical protein [Candidatus Saccharibacteria bacterium]